MLLTEYVAGLQADIALTPFVAATSLSYEDRPPSAAFIKGTIGFLDGSQLDFREFLITQPTPRVLKYGYHYRTGDLLVFRYDNASDPAARDLSTFPHHKHLPGTLVATEQMSLAQVLREIVLQLKFP
jgi:hypothetical protein